MIKNRIPIKIGISHSNWRHCILRSVRLNCADQMSSELWVSSDPETWQATLDTYWDVIDAMPGKEKLPELER